MNSQEKLMRLASSRISKDDSFMSYFLGKYLAFERISEDQMISELNCSLACYYKLALCKAPNPTANDFIQRIQRISEKTGVSVFGISKIIKRVYTINKLSDAQSQSFLMAARDKKKNEDNS